MNEAQISPEDPKLTAYALGELEGDERAAVEAALRLNPALRAQVDEIRAAAAQLEAAFAAEPEVALLNGAAVDGQAAPHLVREYQRPPARGAAKLLRFPHFYYVVGGLAAACFAVMVALNGPRPHMPPQKTYIEVPLASYTAEDQKAAEPPAVAVAELSAPASTAAAAACAGDSNRVVFSPPFGLVEQSKEVADPAPAVSAALRPQSLPPGAPVIAYGQSWKERLGGVPPAARSRPAARGASSDGYADNLFTRGLPRAEPKEWSAKKGNDAGSQRGALGASLVVADAKAKAPAIGGAVALSALPATFAPIGSVSLGENPARPATAPEPEERGNTENYAYQRDNDFLPAAQNPLSTFSIDVDTASYANVRRFLNGDRMPPIDAVRIEELLNYFPYRYDAPKDETPFAASLEVAEAPWAPTHRLVRIGLKGREVESEARPAASLVFLLDVSGSMHEANKLPLVKESLRLLVGRLRPDDRVAIVTYAGGSGLALPSTPVAKSREILDAIDRLRASGGTNGAMGIQLAYDIAKANFATDGLNRVILCTDGDFNVGVSSQGELIRLIEEKAKTGVFLTVLGFGMGNLKDGTLERLADKGNGHYGYIDTRREAEKLLVEQVNGTLVTIAKDVKLQVDFNPAKVASYRLIGYENRLLKAEDFANDKVDAGEIGAGHTVTALYEIVPIGAETPAAAAAEESKYRMRPAQPAGLPAAIADEMLTLRVRYKEPAGDVSRKLEFPLTDRGGRFTDASVDFRFAAAVAGFGMILRESPHKGTATLGDVVAWAAGASAGPQDDPRGYRSDFIGLVRKAQALAKAGD